MATGTPAAAVRIAFAELTLNVFRPPPVPHMSVRFPSTFGLICTQFARIARTIAATSSTVGPFISERDEEAGDLHLRHDVVAHVLDELGDLGSGQVLVLRVSLPSESLNISAPVYRWPTCRS